MTLRGPPLDSQGGGGGAGVFVAGKLFISTELGAALVISHFVTCLYGIVLEVNYLFHAESARNYLFQKYSPPPLGIQWWPPKLVTSRYLDIYAQLFTHSQTRVILYHNRITVLCIYSH